MSQYDFGFIDTAITSGGDLASILAMWRDAILSNHSGTSRPGYVRPGQIWINTTTASNWVINLYDGTSDIPLGYVNSTTDTGGMAVVSTVITKSGSATIALDERSMTVAINATANMVLTLPFTTTAGNGFKIGFVRRDATAFTVNITPQAGEFINGLSTYPLNRQFANIEIISDNAGRWFVYSNLFATATDRIFGRSSSGAGPVEEIACTAAGRALLAAVDAAAQRTALGLAVIDTSVLGGDITAAGKALLDDADAAAQRTTLGLGTGATRNISVGTTAPASPATNDLWVDTN